MVRWRKCQAAEDKSYLVKFCGVVFCGYGEAANSKCQCPLRSVTLRAEFFHSLSRQVSGQARVKWDGQLLGQFMRKDNLSNCLLATPAQAS